MIQKVFLASGKFSVWTSAKVRECHNEVEPKDEDRQSIVQDMLRKSTDVLEADHRASRRTERGHIVVRVPSLSSPPA